MCFSLQASLISSISLFGISMLYIPKLWPKKTRLIAIIPIIFALQQACEAIIWHYKSLQSYSTIATASAYLFIFFAYIFWPIWVPFSLYYAEKNPSRKQLLLASLSCGILISMLLLCLIIFYPIDYCLLCTNIIYSSKAPTLLYFPIAILYSIATIFSWIFSSVKYMWIMGLLLLLSYAISFWFYLYAFTSVWCFFAAINSLSLYLFLDEENL